jgi:hypothetical protein
MGKVSLIMVLGMSIMLIFVQMNISRRSTDATSNFIDYLSDSQLHELKTSAAEIALTVLDRKPMTRGVLLNRYISIGRGSYKDPTYYVKVQIDAMGLDSLKVTSMATHPNPFKRTFLSSAQIDTSWTIIKLQRAAFSQFPYYTTLENGILWYTGDTLWGGNLHTQDFLKTSGTPIFYGKVTTLKGTTDKNYPGFLGGYESPVNNPIPTEFTEIKQAQAEGKAKVYNTDTLKLTFTSDGKVNVKCGVINETDHVDEIAPNGLIIADGFDIRVKGTVVGRVTIASLTKSLKGGSVWIDDNLLLKTTGIDPNVGDLLGVCADKDIAIAGYNNTTSTHVNDQDGVDIQGTFFARTGSFFAQYHDKRIVTVRKTLRLYGGIIQNSRGAVGLTSGTGFKKSYRFDPRLARARPPFYPLLNVYRIISWWE